MSGSVVMCPIHHIHHGNHVFCPVCVKENPEKVHAAFPIPKAPTPLQTQVSGSHYKELKIQPVEYIHGNGIPFIEGCVIKYVTRWRAKGGVEDLKKARHFLDILIDLETR